MASESGIATTMLAAGYLQLACRQIRSLAMRLWKIAFWLLLPKLPRLLNSR